MNSSKRKITSEWANSIYLLAWLAAKDEGLFDEEGIEVEFKKPRESQPEHARMLLDDRRQISSMMNHVPFEEGEYQVYRGCSWGNVQRTLDSRIGGKILNKRTAIVSEAIVVLPGSIIVRPQDLANIPIGVRMYAGTEYQTTLMLEGFLRPDEIKMVHTPKVANRYRLFKEGRVEAIAVSEPWISFAEHEGCRVIIEAQHIGTEAGSPDIDPLDYAACTRAVKKAVRLINANPKKYLHYLVDEIPEDMRGDFSVDHIHLPRIWFVDPMPYTREDFDRDYSWMVSKKLIKPGASFDQLVNNMI